MDAQLVACAGRVDFRQFAPQKLDFTAELRHADPAEIISRLGDREYRVVANYRDSIAKHRTLRTERGKYTIGEYFRAEMPGSRDMISEEVASGTVDSLLGWPTWFHPVGSTRLFCGKAQCVSDLHVDWYSHWLLHTTLVGHQKVYLFPPGAAKVFKSAGNIACINFRGMPYDERREFIAITGGCELDAEAGDALAIPPFWWHHFEYMEPSIATSTGFGPIDRYVESFTSDLRLPRDWRLALLYSNMWCRSPLTSNQKNVCELVRIAYRDAGADSSSRERLVNQALAGLIVQSTQGGDATEIISDLSIDT